MAAETPAPKSLDEALLMLQADLPTLVKDKDGQVGHQKTKYADLVQVNAVVLKRLNALGCVAHGRGTPAPTAQRSGSAPALPTETAITDAQQQKMGALMREHGITERAAALALVNEVLQRPADNQITSRTELTRAEASQVIDRLQRESERDEHATPTPSSTPAETS
jgi:hypothetical protein